MYINEADYEAYSWENQQFYDGIEKLSVSKEQNQFKFYHLKGTHVPHVTTRDFVDISWEDMPGGGQGTEAMVESGRGLLVLVDAFLNELKEKGVYDNSVVIVMADHGGDYKYEYDWRRECPLFIVKGVNERHKLEVNDKPFSFYDLQDVWKKLLSGEDGRNMDVYTEGNRRIFRQYWWEGDLKYSSYGSDIIEFETTDHAYNYDSLKEDGIVFEAPKKEE